LQQPTFGVASVDGAEAGAKKTPRVLIVSDVRLYREGLAAILAATGRVQMAGVEAPSDFASNLGAINLGDIDVVLLDAELLKCPAWHGWIELASAKIVAFAVSEIDDDIDACARSGVASFVGKDGSVEDILSAIEGIWRGELPCPSRVAALLFRRLTGLLRSQPQQRAGNDLTDRELEVMSLLDRGCSNKEIARQLGIGLSTVKNHVHNILDKLHVHRRGEAAAAMRRVLRGDIGQTISVPQ
jgi:DNA-binding NarL/FixJ family response regulator